MNHLLKNDSRTRIWFVTGDFPPRFSGAGKNDLVLAPLCSGNGLAITLVSGRHPGDPQRGIINGVPVLRISRGGHTIWSRLLNCLRFLALLSCNPRPSMIRFRGFGFGTSLTIAMIKLVYPNIKIVVQPAMFGGDDAFSIQKKPLGALLFHQILKTDAIFSMNTLIRDSFLKTGYPADRIYPVNNPVGIDTFHPLPPDQKRALRQHLDLPEDAFIFITSGILSRRKNQSLVTEAFLHMLAANSSNNGYLLHMGPTSSELEKLGSLLASYDARTEENFINSLLSTNEHRDRVLLVGYQKNPELYLQASDVFVHASKYEGEANVVNEALACGLPSLVPNIPLYAEQAPPKCVVQYEKDSSDALYHAMAGLLSDCHRNESMAVAAREHIMKTRHPELVAKHYVEILLALAGTR